jgi:hypothetical protein
MRGELELWTWKNIHCEECGIYVDRKAMEKTLALIVELEKLDEMEVVLAYDIKRLNEEENKELFWPGNMWCYTYGSFLLNLNRTSKVFELGRLKICHISRKLSGGLF